MKKVWLSAMMVLAVAGIGSSAALGEGELRVFLGGERIADDLPASAEEPVEDVINRMGAFVDYDDRTGKMDIIRPNVNVLVLEGVQQTRSKTVVLSNPVNAYSDKDVPRTFNVFVEVDNAPVDKDLRVQVELIAPDGKKIDEGKEKKFSTKNANSFYFSEPFVSTKLDQYGTYKVQVLMKHGKSNIIVGENTFTVGR
jgi:hypothetical protein